MFEAAGDSAHPARRSGKSGLNGAGNEVALKVRRQDGIAQPASGNGGAGGDAGEEACTGLCFLVIEDDSRPGATIRCLLQGSRFHHAAIRRARDGAALRALMHAPIDLVVADFWLGTRPSVSLINDISAALPHVPVIMLGAFPDAGGALDASTASLFYLSKAGLTPEALDCAIDRALAGFGAMDAARAAAMQAGGLPV